VLCSVHPLAPSKGGNNNVKLSKVGHNNVKASQVEHTYASGFSLGEKSLPLWKGTPSIPYHGASSPCRIWLVVGQSVARHGLEAPCYGYVNWRYCATSAK